MASSQIALSTCARLVEQAGAQCAAHAATVPATAVAAPDFNAMATSLAAQNNAIAIGAACLGGIGLVVAVAGLIAGLAWAEIVTKKAERLAVLAAADAAKKAASEWMDAQGHQLVADEVAKIMQERMAQTQAEAEAEASDLEEAGDEDKAA